MVEQVRPAERTSHTGPWLALPLLLLGYLWVFWPSLARMESIWRHSETYMHAYLILPISLWLVWRQRGQWLGLAPKTTLLPAIAAFPFAILWLLAYAIDVNFVSQFAAIFFLQLLLWSVLGHRLMRILWFPVAFLVFLVPFGEAANPILQNITADMVVYFLRLVDFPIFREGLYIYTPSAVFEVAVACSGLNFLLTSLVLSCLYSYLHYRHWYKAIAFIALTLALSIIANGIRAFLLVVIGEKSNLAYGFGADHYYYGWLVFFIVIMLAFWLGAKFADDEAPAVSASHAAKSSKASKIAWVALLLLSLTMLAVGASSRSMQQTEVPEQPAQLLAVDQSIAERSSWGIQFYDGLTRDHWLSEDGVELFVASYAHRQQRGDMITWHNTLYRIDQWSITAQQDYGSRLDGYRVLQLSSPGGQRRSMLYWYQLGEYRTSNRIVMKLLQLQALLRGQNDPAYVVALSLSGHYSMDESQQRLLQAREQQLTGLLP